MPIVKRIVQMLIATFIIASVLGIIFFTYLYYDTKPILEGIIPAEKITNSTEIIRDRNGIVHIYARDDLDAYYSLGYAVAQDRLWQMVFLRMTVSGKLSEFLGEKYFEIDKSMRTLRIYEKSKEIAEILLNRNGNANYMKCMLKYLQGINTYIEQIGNDLPIEFRLLFINPELFKLHDIYAVSALFRYIMTYDKSMIGSLINDYGFDDVSEAFLAVELSEQDIGTHKSAIQAYKTSVNPYPSFNKELYEFFNTHFSDFTGNIVAVSGSKSKLRIPILTNSISLPSTLPQILYEAHIVTPQQNFTGFFTPLSPFGLMGQNDHVSWGISNSMLDDTDYYLETLNPNNPNQYLYKNDWVDMELIKTKIKISGKGNEKELILKKTRNGIVISEFQTESVNSSWKSHKALVFKWAFYDLPATKEQRLDIKNKALLDDWFHTFYILNHAEDYKQFKEGLQTYNGVGLELIYADIFGFVIKNVIGKVPKRKEYSAPLFYMDNYNGDYDWDGYYDKKIFYYYVNSDKGFLISSNTPIEKHHAYITGEDGEQLYYSYFFNKPYRYNRIEKMLQEQNKFGIDDMKALHADYKDTIAEKLIPIIKAELEKYPDNEFTMEEQMLYDLLSWWDCYTEKEKNAPLIFSEIYRQLIIFTFKDNSTKSKDLLNFALTDELSYTNFSELLLKNPKSKWFDDKDTTEIETLKEAMRQALGKAYESLKKQYGSDIDSWEWGDSHRLSYKHILGSRFPKKVLNTDIYSVPGSFGSISKSIYNPRQPFVISKNTYAIMIANTNNFKRSLFLLSPGNSGHFHNNNYKNQISMWLNNTYADPTNTREWTYKEMVDRIKLVPKE